LWRRARALRKKISKHSRVMNERKYYDEWILSSLHKAIKGGGSGPQKAFWRSKAGCPSIGGESRNKKRVWEKSKVKLEIYFVLLTGG